MPLLHSVFVLISIRWISYGYVNRKPISMQFFSTTGSDKKLRHDCTCCELYLCNISAKAQLTRFLTSICALFRVSLFDKKARKQSRSFRRNVAIESRQKNFKEQCQINNVGIQTFQSVSDGKERNRVKLSTFETRRNK